ncbi:MAG TPA: hypothetical protein VNQ99_17810 [Xanthobacteraceae bacterium]|nr:hypothetical protein [Xanthobacteraceae bacterium]
MRTLLLEPLRELARPGTLGELAALSLFFAMGFVWLALGAVQ